MHSSDNLSVEYAHRQKYEYRVSVIAGEIQRSFDPTNGDDREAIKQLAEGDLEQWISKELEKALDGEAVEILSFDWSWGVEDGCFVVSAVVEEFDAQWQLDEDAAYEDSRALGDDAA